MLAKNEDGEIQQREFSQLFDNRVAFSKLSAPRSYTVVEVYIDSCSYCRELVCA